MGLLEELQWQSESIIAEERAARDGLAARCAAAHGVLEGALRYWEQFCAALNVVKPPVFRNYHIEGTTQLADLHQSEYHAKDYRHTVDERDYIESVALSFRCTSNYGVTIEKKTAPVVDRLREHLWFHGLKFDLQEMRRDGAYIERGIFSVKPEVYVHVLMAADIERSQIRMTVRNLERLGAYTSFYDHDEVGIGLFEELGKALLGRPHKLRATGRQQAALLDFVRRAA